MPTTLDERPPTDAPETPDAARAAAVESEWDAADRQMTPAQRRRIRNWVIATSSVIVLMIGFTAVNVPLFNLLCRVVGYDQNPNAAADQLGTEGIGREIEVIYMANIIGSLPVSFRPDKRVQRTHIGETTLNDYHFVNLTDRKIYFRPVHSIRPVEAAKEFHLSECFCFDDQVLLPRQEISLPVVFKLGGDIPATTNHVTLNYTLFELTESEFKAGQTTFNKEASH
jgi:cytochrome c oxidase assembly protein subunit 11